MAEYLRSHGAKTFFEIYKYKFYDVDDGPNSINRAIDKREFEYVKVLVRAGKHDINRSTSA